jgi:NAD(P)H-nitrite reductase large subunit
MKKSDIFVCRCEEITEEEILKAIEMGARDLDAVKRITRSGMGLCQGKTCSVLIREILNRELKIDKEELPPCTARPPLRLIPSKAFLNVEKTITSEKEQ